jgi:hypothetical protein
LAKRMNTCTHRRGHKNTHTTQLKKNKKNNK